MVAQRCSVKTLFLEILQNSQENMCARVSFTIKLQNTSDSCFWTFWSSLRFFIMNYYLGFENVWKCCKDKAACVVVILLFKHLFTNPDSQGILWILFTKHEMHFYSKLSSALVEKLWKAVLKSSGSLSDHRRHFNGYRVNRTNHSFFQSWLLHRSILW